MKNSNLDRRAFLRNAAVGGVLVASGEALALERIEGRVTASGKPLAGAVITDGLNCTETAADGSWALPANDKSRFVTLTVPSGWKTAKRYHKYAGTAQRYDFALEPWSASKPGAFCFVHIGDSEISMKRLPDEERWVARARDLVAAKGAAFVVHTGDIGGKEIPKHAELMNEATVGCPVYYVVGNHDIKGGPKGEEIFEGALGPCWYSFDAGGTHFVEVPMMWGDGKPSYRVDEIVAWLRNDLAIAARKQQPVMLLVHGGMDTRVLDMRKFLQESVISTESSEPFDLTSLCRVTAIIHGHIHENYFNRTDDGKIAMISAAPPNKNDATLQTVRVTADGQAESAEYLFDLESEWHPVATPPKGGWLAKVERGYVVYSMPEVGAGKVYIGVRDYSGASRPGFYAFDEKTGNPCWFFKTRGDIVSSAICRGNRVYVNDAHWQVYAIDAASGREIWHFNARDVVGYTGSKMWGGASGFSSSFLNYDDATKRLYVGSAYKSLFALDVETAKVVWHAEAETGCFLGSPTACAICDDVIVGRAHWAGTFGYDAKTGKSLWIHRLGDAPTAQERHRMATPWLYCMGKSVYRNGRLCLTGHNHYFEVEPKSGTIIRQKEFPFSLTIFTGPLFLDGRIYFGSASEGLICLDEQTLEVVWKAPVEVAKYSLPTYKYSPIRSLCSVPVVWKGMIWATAQDGALYAWDPKSGERRERIDTGVPYLSSPTVSGDRLFAADFTGHLRCFR